MHIQSKDVGHEMKVQASSPTRSLKQISVSCNGSENFRSGGYTCLFIYLFFSSGKKNIFMHFERGKKINFSRKPEKILGFTSKFR